MDAQSPYAPPDAPLYEPEPGDDSPLPFEDPEHYPTLRRRVVRTIRAFVNRPVWFFHRVGLGPESLWKPFQFYLLAWSPVFALSTIIGVLAIVVFSVELSSKGDAHIVFASSGLSGFTKAILLISFPMWSAGLMLAYGLVIHAGLKLAGRGRSLALVNTLRASMYAGFWFPALYLFITSLRFIPHSIDLPPAMKVTLCLAVVFTFLLIGGFAKIHGISKPRSMIAVFVGLSLIAPLGYYTHSKIFTHLQRAIIELKGWAL